MTDETEIGGPDALFQPTAWTAVRQAQTGSPEAMERLVSTCWKPAYFFIRRRGNDVEASKDLTQSFFATALGKDFLDGIASERGA